MELSGSPELDTFDAPVISSGLAFMAKSSPVGALCFFIKRSGRPWERCSPLNNEIAAPARGTRPGCCLVRNGSVFREKLSLKKLLGEIGSFLSLTRGIKREKGKGKKRLND